MTFSQNPSIPNNQEQGNNYAISNADVYIRDGPSSEYYAIGVINKGDTVLILESSKSIWSKIQYKDATGYTSRKFLENIEIDTSRLATSQTSPEPLKEEPSQSNFYIGTALLFFIFFLIIFLIQNSGKQNKSKSTASLLALFGSTFGLQRFYLGQVGKGVLSILFSWTFIPTVIGVIDFIYFLVIGEAKFDKKYNGKKRRDSQNSKKNQTIIEKDNFTISNNKHSLSNTNSVLKESKIKNTSFSIKSPEVSEISRDVFIEPADDDIIDINKEEVNLDIESEKFEEVPYWPHQYVYSYSEINSASNSHKKFYIRYKSNFLKGNLLDIRGNTNYAFILYFDLLNEFENHQNIQKLEQQFLLLGKSCPKTKSYSLYALIDILRLRNDYTSLELLKKLEDPSYQYEAGFSDYDPNAYKLGTQYKSKLDLSKNEIELLNKFYNPSNVFNSVEGCCVAIIEQYLKMISSIENELVKEGSSLNEEISELQMLVKEHFRVGDNFYELKYINNRVESESYLTIFRRVENSIRTYYGHKRKISAVFPYSENRLNEQFEERIGRILDKEIIVNQLYIKKPDISTQIQLNYQNVNRWKSEFTDLLEALKNEKTAEFYDGIIHLEKVNQKNTNIENILYEASKVIAKYDKTQALKYYAKYINYDINSDKVHNKQLTKTVQKSLFKTERQIIKFKQIIQELFEKNNLEEVLDKFEDFYKIQRKKIVLDRNEIQEVEKKHSTTVDILNKYLVNEDGGVKEKINQLDSEEEISISFSTAGSEQSKFIDSLVLNKTQEELLFKIAQNEFSIFQPEVEQIALKNGILKNQLIDSINDACFDFLEGEVLIEEEEEYYIVEQSYYQEIIKNK